MTMDALKTSVRKLFHRAGYDFHRLIPEMNATFQVSQGLLRFGVDLVLDVGANAGQFGRELRSMGYRGRIVSFEPLSGAHQRLRDSAKSDPAWTVMDRCAVGDRDGDVTINIAGNSVSSSLLPMTDAHLSAARSSAYVGQEQVRLVRLDSVASAHLASARAPFLKIDTQGYEWAVLDGADSLLPRLTGVLCELSLVPLYEGQHLWLDVIHRLGTAGFRTWAVQPGFTDHRDGRTLQLDALFFRT
jgi:FkbM family methyltransferase